MIKNKFLSPELTRLAIVIIAAKLVIDLVLAQTILGMCYAKDNALDNAIEKTVDSELSK